MTNTMRLYSVAEKENISIVNFPAPENGSFSIEGGGRCYIAIDRGVLQEVSTACVHLAHEIGHCVTGSFYNRWAKIDVRQKHENKADKWAIEHTIMLEELDDAIAAGYSEIWSLAEHFGVTEDFMRKAVCWYTHGNLDTQLYF